MNGYLALIGWLKAFGKSVTRNYGIVSSIDPLQKSETSIVASEPVTRVRQRLVSFSEHILDTRAASAFSEDSHPVAHLMHNKWLRQCRLVVFCKGIIERSARKPSAIRKNVYFTFFNGFSFSYFCGLRENGSELLIVWCLGYLSKQLLKNASD